MKSADHEKFQPQRRENPYNQPENGIGADGWSDLHLLF